MSVQQTARPLLRDLSPADLPPLAGLLGEPPYRGRQLSRWLFRAGALRWEEMTDLPAGFRERLATGHDLQGLAPLERQVSADGTRKHLFRLRDGACVESVTIPMVDHATFCISSQVGCAMACRFCATARGGRERDLSPGEILEQVVHLGRDLRTRPFPGHGDRKHNIVLMGMGEPLDNWAAVSAALRTLVAPAGFGVGVRRITLSTAGRVEVLASLPDGAPAVGLTLSVCGASEEVRRRWMPVASRTPLPRLLDLAEAYARRLRRRVTVAYVLVPGASDGPAEAERLASLLRGRPFKVNLIPLNPWQGGAADSPPDSEAVLGFQAVLDRAGVPAFIRESGGRDIDAACGQLRRRRRA